MSNAPAPTRAEEGREYVEDGCRVVYGRTWDGPFEKMPTEGMKDVWRDLVRKAQQPIATHLSAAEARAAQAEAEVARLTAAVAISEIAVRSLQARAAAFERVLKVRHPLTGKDASAWLVLADLAAQEGCDGEPYDTMQAVADALRAAFIGGGR